eukprot:CAMPEP_0176425048 /NCGR_PEP_ID=MMETSP0127-20121128/11181_1 /TAXON_ID=938130 /ORGANISM="Platyophrya macrostoma, Strain WH" /LENGTH=574 /DNA_ID=CAMNT_0017806183 /DNA_START=34 /DNA_END=1758 /DNA_ORIENTATION=+
MTKLLILLLALTIVGTYAIKNKDKINIYVNKVSPWANPSESYRYYSLPFCRPDNAQEVSESIGEKLSGNRKMTSHYETFLQTTVEKKKICGREFTREEMDTFRRIARENYLFEFFVEDIVVGNVAGYSRDGVLYLVTHLVFNIWYNKETESLITADVQVRDFESIDITDENKKYYLTFSYSVNYIESEETATINSNKGYDTYFSDEVHWITVISGVSMSSMLWLLAFIITIKVSKTDVSDTYIGNDTGDSKVDDDKSKIKSLRNEVFLRPAYSNVLAAATGSGVQLMLIVILMCFLGTSGTYYSGRGSLYTTAVVIYSLTAVIAGVVSSRVYMFIGGKLQSLNIIFTACLFPVPLFTVAFLINIFAWVRSLTSALPFVTIIFVLFMWAVVTIPLTIFGGITAGRTKQDELIADANANVKGTPRVIPNELKSWCFALAGGLLPATVMYIELYYIFTAVWGHKIYTMWGMLFVYFVLCLNLTACSSVVLTYNHLVNLDYKWWWKSFLHGGSMALYLWAYSIYYYFAKSGMFGFTQSLFYFGYTSMACLFAGLLFGSVSFLSSLSFVHYMFEKSKVN